MTSFIFWNVHAKHLASRLAILAQRNDVDIIMLAENATPPADTLRSLNAGRKNLYYYVPSRGCDKIEIYARFSAEFIPAIYEDHRTTMRHLRLPGLNDILLAITHFPDKLHWSGDSQSFECIELSQKIRRSEKRIGHTRTVLVGDLNMNPFETGVVSANGLHGVMSRQIAERKKRVVQGKEYIFFYNPMWNYMGDYTSGPPGTYYYNNAEHRVFFWNVFDQLLVRPELLPFFKNEDLRVLDSDGETSLLSLSGLPDDDAASDHLPIFFKLTL